MFLAISLPIIYFTFLLHVFCQHRSFSGLLSSSTTNTNHTQKLVTKIIALLYYKPHYLDICTSFNNCICQFFNHFNLCWISTTVDISIRMAYNYGDIFVHAGTWFVICKSQLIFKYMYLVESNVV